jgi:aromatic ring-opening dioxygenase catalytic subunit (LigB family)
MYAPEPRALAPRGIGLVAGDVCSGRAHTRNMTFPASRMPVAFIPHGGGPWPFVDMGMDKSEVEHLSAYLRELASLPGRRPRAVLVISAHWEERVPTLLSGAHPPLLFDYYGFPPESYELTWPAPGAPAALQQRVLQLLQAAGFESALDPERGYDHGTFVPLKLSYPHADVPILQLSLQRGLDPALHLKLGAALAPLRDEEIFIVGSGMSFHNLRGFRDPRSRAPSERFHAWLSESVALDAPARAERLVQWSSAPDARFVHPREEHLLPLMVVAGAAAEDRGHTAWSGTVLGMQVCAYHFGAGV